MWAKVIALMRCMQIAALFHVPVFNTFELTSIEYKNVSVAREQLYMTTPPPLHLLPDLRHSCVDSKVLKAPCLARSRFSDICQVRQLKVARC